LPLSFFPLSPIFGSPCLNRDSPDGSSQVADNDSTMGERLAGPESAQDQNETFGGVAGKVCCWGCSGRKRERKRKSPIECRLSGAMRTCQPDSPKDHSFDPLSSSSRGTAIRHAAMRVAGAVHPIWLALRTMLCSVV
jgi:hypothetical protein